MYKIISTAITKKVYKKIQTKHYKLKKKKQKRNHNKCSANPHGVRKRKIKKQKTESRKPKNQIKWQTSPPESVNYENTPIKR